MADAPADRVVADALFDGLTRLSPEGGVVPELASSWSVSADGLEVVFLLRDDARFHDGTPVTAGDVVRGWTRVLSPPVDGAAAPPAAVLLDAVQGAADVVPGETPSGLSAPDDTTFVVRTVRPSPDLPAVAAHPALAPVPTGASEPGFATEPVGNGPFRLAEPARAGQFVRLQRFAAHPDPAALGGVEFRVYRGDLTGTERYADLQRGLLDVAVVPPGRRDEARAAFGASDGLGSPGVRDGTLGLASVLVLDTTTSPTDLLGVRRALSLLVDREALAARSGDRLVAADGLLPPSLPLSAGVTCRWCRFDPASARELLPPPDQLAGLPPLVVVASDDGVHAAMARELVARLRAVGLSARVELPDRADYLATVEDLSSGSAVRIAWAPVAPDLASWSTRLLGAGAPGRALSGYAPPALRELLAEARGSSDGALRRLADLSALRLALDEAVVVPLLHYRDPLVTDVDVRGLVRGPLGEADLSEVVLQEE